MIADADVLAALDRQQSALRDTVRFVHEHPELGHDEHECAAYLCETLDSAGLELERGVGGMETAFKATLSGARQGSSVGLVCLYDAVPAMRAGRSRRARSFLRPWADRRRSDCRGARTRESS